jgi:hypothetical protein
LSEGLLCNNLSKTFYDIMRYFLCAILLLFTLGVFAQPVTRGDDANFGVTNTEMIDLLMPSIPGVAVDPRDKMEQQSVKPYMMPVRKIGPAGSDLSYALATCLEFYVNLENNYKDNLSPDYIQLSLESSGKAINLPEACRFLANVGTVSAAIMPYDARTIPNAVYATQKYGISNYLHIFQHTTKARQRVFDTKKALMRGHPVLVELKASPELRQMLRTTTWVPPKEATMTFPLVVVGYNEVEQSFEVMSSWGSSWGRSGYLQIAYDDFGQYAVNGYVLVPSQYK